MKVFSTYAGLPRSIYILVIGTIVNRMGDFVNFFLTLFLTKNLAFSEPKAGIFILCSGTASMVGNLISGKLGDHIGRKKIIIIAQSLSALLLIPCGFLGNSILIPYFLIASSFFIGAVRPMNSSIITDLTYTEEERKKAFSLMYLGINVGVAAGPLIAGLLFKNYIQWIFWGDAITSLVCILLIILFVPETLPSTEDMNNHEKLHENERAERGRMLGALLRRPILMLFLMISLLHSFVYAQHVFALPLQLDLFFGKDSAKLFGYLMSFNAITVLVMTTIMVNLTHRFRPIHNMTISFLFYTIGFGMLSFVRTFPLFIVSTFLWTIGEIISVTNHGVYVANHTPISHRGRFNAFINIIFGVGFSLGPVISGKFIKQFSVVAIWPWVSLLSLFCAFAMYILSIYEQSKKPCIE